jgi:hypothetical protein
MIDIGKWLEQIDLGEYTEVFAVNKADAEVLSALTSDDLKDIGVGPVGDRRRLLNAITSLYVTDSPSPDELGQSRSSAHASQRAERREFTVMFCCLVGSAALSQRLDPVRSPYGGIVPCKRAFGQVQRPDEVFQIAADVDGS